ncbi:MAG: hypothetical protein ACI8WM_001840, partial [Burkholderiaceae bacterium]
TDFYIRCQLKSGFCLLLIKLTPNLGGLVPILVGGLVGGGIDLAI